MLDTVKINHVQHISFTQSRLTDAVSVILSELLSYEHPSKPTAVFVFGCAVQSTAFKRYLLELDEKAYLPYNIKIARRGGRVV